MYEVIHEEIITDVPLPPTSFNHLPVELKTIILEYTIAASIREIRSALQWEIFDAARKKIRELRLNRVCSKIMNNKLITKTILDQLESKIKDDHITCFMGSKIEPPVRLFCMAERLGTKAALDYAISHPEWKNYFEKIKSVAITTSNPQFKRHLNAFVVRLAGGYSFKEYTERSTTKIKDEPVVYGWEDTIRTLNLSEDSLYTLHGLQELNDHKLECIKINNNFITNLEAPYFAGFMNLMDIEIKGNKNLKSVDFGIFAPLRYLRQIDFSYNGITAFECSRKLETDRLYELDLCHNALEVVSLHAVANINAKRVDLFGNPLREIATDKPCEYSRKIEILLRDRELVARFEHLWVEEKLWIL